MHASANVAPGKVLQLLAGLQHSTSFLRKIDERQQALSGFDLATC